MLLKQFEIIRLEQARYTIGKWTYNPDKPIESKYEPCDAYGVVCDPQELVRAVDEANRGERYFVFPANWDFSYRPELLDASVRDEIFRKLSLLLPSKLEPRDLAAQMLIAIANAQPLPAYNKGKSYLLCDLASRLYFDSDFFDQIGSALTNDKVLLKVLRAMHRLIVYGNSTDQLKQIEDVESIRDHFSATRSVILS